MNHFNGANEISSQLDEKNVTFESSFKLLRFTKEIFASEVVAMKELLRSNNHVELSFVQSLLKDAGIAFLLLDENMSILEGSIGILPRRILVDPGQFSQAKKLLAELDHQFNE